MLDSRALKVRLAAMDILGRMIDNLRCMKFWSCAYCKTAIVNEYRFGHLKGGDENEYRLADHLKIGLMVASREWKGHGHALCDKQRSVIQH